MRSLAFFLLLMTSATQAFTLNNNFSASFKKSRVKVFVAGDSTCTQFALTQADLQSYVKPAVERFWNKVPTSRLRLKSSGFSSPISGVDITQARLCSPTDSACISDANTKGQTVLPGVQNIIISCNQLADNFQDTSVLAVTVPNKFSGKKIKGAVILIYDNSSNPFKNLSRSDRIGVIAHEIGHAIGLGHSEEEKALMYYKVVDQRETLGEDDMDGVTYLYPVKLDGCGIMDSLVASTVAFKGKGKDDDTQGGGGSSFWQMGIGFLFFLVLTEILKLLKRYQARPAL